MQKISSPNWGSRKARLKPDMVVLHYTAMKTAEDAIERLCDVNTEVSAHYLIDEVGKITQLVCETQRAWHAGAGSWGNVSDVNSHSIGIELANQGPMSLSPEFPEKQISALEQLLRDILQRHSISKERVIAHSDMAPGRKFDPGSFFNWKGLASKGLSVWVKPNFCINANWAEFKIAAEVFGYRRTPDTIDAWQYVLDAFRMRFNPNKSGILDISDVAMIQSLAQNFPCKDVDLGDN